MPASMTATMPLPRLAGLHDYARFSCSAKAAWARPISPASKPHRRTVVVKTIHRASLGDAKTRQRFPPRNRPDAPLSPSERGRIPPGLAAERRAAVHRHGIRRRHHARRSDAQARSPAAATGRQAARPALPVPADRPRQRPAAPRSDAGQHHDRRCRRPRDETRQGDGFRPGPRASASTSRPGSSTPPPAPSTAAPPITSARSKSRAGRSIIAAIFSASACCFMAC